MNTPANALPSSRIRTNFLLNYMSSKIISQYAPQFYHLFHDVSGEPWNIVSVIPEIIQKKISNLSSGYIIKGDVAIHETATVEQHVVLKGPLIISEGCFIGAHAYLRGGVFLDSNVK